MAANSSLIAAGQHSFGKQESLVQNNDQMSDESSLSSRNANLVNQQPRLKESLVPMPPVPSRLNQFEGMEVARNFNNMTADTNESIADLYESGCTPDSSPQEL